MNINKNKLTKDELVVIARLLRGRRKELAERAKVSKQTVNNTLQAIYQNEDVLIIAKEMIEELTPNPQIQELRMLIAEA
jgi:PBP1b-binding outer membrane lipoprotein LpoB